MTRVLLAAAALAALPLDSRAAETAVHLVVRPMAAPKPALKYRLLPELRELNPGNAAQSYLKCFMEQRNFFFGKEAAAERARYRAMPLVDLPVDLLRDYGGYALHQADWAARLNTVDWQNPPHRPTRGIDEVPGELGPLQVLATALQVRFRAEVARRCFDDALRTAKTIFALSRHLGEHPTEVASLVGLSIAHLGLNSLEEAVQQPGCPNLYWALTELPCPLVDVRRGADGDRSLVAAELRLLHDDTRMTAAELAAFVSRISSMLSFAREQRGLAPRNLRSQLQGALQTYVSDPDRMRSARCRLVEAGCAENLVKKLLPQQVVLLDEKHLLEIQWDERAKLLALPLWQTDCLYGCEERQQFGHELFADLLPEVNKLRQAQAQLEQQIALLRHVEGLRHYAAKHAGKLPETLSDIPLPLPVDPVSGKPFCYAIKGATADFVGALSRGEETDAQSSVHYYVTIQR
jgi:hypothetical protein